MNKTTVKNLILLQAVVILYTGSSIMAKLASGQEAFSFRFFAFYGGELAVLALYALFWQQMIKRFQLSVAYANRAMALLWSMIWAVIFFHDTITVNKIIGVLLVIAGTFVINSEKKEEGE